MKVVEYLSPYIPFLGFRSGGITNENIYVTIKRTKKAKLNLLRFIWKLTVELKDDL